MKVNCIPFLALLFAPLVLSQEILGSSSNEKGLCRPACRKGHKCVFVAINCITTPCPPGHYECLPDTDYNPCMTVKCAAGTRCESFPDTTCNFGNCPLVAKCVADTTPSVRNYCHPRCPKGYECSFVPYICRRPPCPLGSYQCLVNPDYNPCMTVRCRAGTHCESVTNKSCNLFGCPPTAKCVADTPACNLACMRGYTCEVKQVQCIWAPCPPIEQCVVDPNYNPCETVRCTSGTRCVAVPNTDCTSPCPPIAQCVADACETGYKCDLVQVQCIRAPCPPIAQCVVDPEYNPCAAALCVVGSSCVSVPNPGCAAGTCPPLAQCQPIGLQLCDGECETGYKCELKQVQCVRAPCPPIAQCVVDPEYNPCIAALCEAGAICLPAPNLECSQATCPPKAQCVPIGSQLCNLDCKTGYKCELKEVQCKRAPCPPIPRCVIDPDYKPCASVRCKSGTSCMVMPNSSCTLEPCPPVAKCLPDKYNLCKSVICPESLKCIEDPDTDNTGSGSTGQCAPLYCEFNPCLYTKCPSNGGNAYCVPVKNAEYPSCLSNTECCPVIGDCRFE